MGERHGLPVHRELLLEADGYTTGYELWPLDARARGLLREGENVLAGDLYNSGSAVVVIADPSQMEAQVLVDETEVVEQWRAEARGHAADGGERVVDWLYGEQLPRIC